MPPITLLQEAVVPALDGPAPAPAPAAPSPTAEDCERRLACSLREAFNSIPEVRKPKGLRYPLGSLLSLATVAILAGCKNPSQIYHFGVVNPRWLKRLGFRPPKRPRRKENRGRVRAPNEDTISSVFARIPADVFNQVLARWVASHLRWGTTANLDGKALRGADEHILSVFVGQIGQVAWQETVGTKENELSALERVIATVLEHYPAIRLWTGDAMFCHKTIARALVEARRDYFLQLKAPHKTDVAIAKTAFAQLMTLPPLATDSGEKRGVQTGRNG
jgi:hypothetical protein